MSPLRQSLLCLAVLLLTYVYLWATEDLMRNAVMSACGVQPQ
ncbi:MAG TPA: hypothetical protein VFS39_03810 [Nitrospira sp.]|nr:hypothetical protein [Nitrospira sp.]